MSEAPTSHPNARPTGIDHVQLAAPPGSEAQASAFYGDLLGLRALEKPAALRARGGAWFALGSVQLHIGIEDPFSPAAKAHPALSVPSAGIDAFARRLAAAGARVQWDDAIPGVRRFYSQDPWGNRLEFVASAAGADATSG